MNIPLRGGDFAVTHDSLDDAGRDGAFCQICAGGVAAAVGSQLPCADALQNGVILLVEIIFVDVDQLFAGRLLDQNPGGRE